MSAGHADAYAFIGDSFPFRSGAGFPKGLCPLAHLPIFPVAGADSSPRLGLGWKIVQRFAPSLTNAYTLDDTGGDA